MIARQQKNALRRVFEIKLEMNETTSQANRATRSARQLIKFEGRAGRRATGID
jgi:hypothetical protein